nr:hypothetical protein [Brucella anthropi]
MNQLAKTEDFTTKATEQEMFECLTLLSSLPSRASANDQVNIAGYYLALEGVSRHGLQTTTKLILQGSLGHAFLPSPPELRQECNKVMKPILEAQSRDAERARILKDQKEMLDAMNGGNWTPESRARATEKWQSVRAAMQQQKAEENEHDAAIARLQASAAANGHELDLDTMKPVSTGSFKQAGKAA